MDSCKYKYQARRAQIVYHDTLKESRQGISLTDEEMEALDNLVSPLLLQGQSIHAIFINHKNEIPCSETTLYDYVDHCYLTARNIDMPRKVRFKQRYSHGPREKSFQEFAAKRTYMDFKKFLDDNPDANVWEMDTVIGEPGGKNLLTLLFRKSTFMMAILLDSHTQDAVIEALNDICRTIGIKLFQKLFTVIITDRGIEFGNPYAIECDENGEIKTKLFYCDSYCSWQKGMIEKNHEFIRMVLPKGKSFDNLSQMDIHLMMNHINNYPRESLNGATPYELSKLLLGKDFLQPLGYHKIPADSVILKPMLLQKTKR
jgi:IS30 family transposase